VPIAPGQPFAGLTATQYWYTANSGSYINPGDVEASVGTKFEIDYVPIFQFLAFYQKDLEILPGPVMNLHGAIHTNGALYLNTSGGTLTVNELKPTIPTVHISAVKDIYRGRKDDGTCAGTVQVAALVDANNDGNFDLQTIACSGGSSTPLSKPTIASFLGSLRANQPAVAVPSVSALARGTGDWWHKADLRIVLNTTNAENGYYPIEAQNDAGDVDAIKNPILQTFLLQKPGRIFYNDVPMAGKGNLTSCGSGDSYCNPASYAK